MKTFRLFAIAAFLSLSAPVWAQGDQNKTQADQSKAQSDQSTVQSDQSKAQGDQSNTQGDQSAPKRLRISTGVAHKLKIHDVQPTYPEAARMKGIQGVVLLEATIDTKGNIKNIKVLKGDPILVDASIDALKQWKYHPYILNGEPVEVDSSFDFRFYRR